MNHYKIVITDSDYEDFPAEREILEPIGCEIVKLNVRDEDVLARSLRDADGVLFQWAKLTLSLIHI